VHQFCFGPSRVIRALNVGEQQTTELVDIINFKWLMAHEGHYVHVQRLQTDQDYARTCIAQAMATSVQALREAALRLSPPTSSSSPGH
jgi:hypothetical protein